MRARSRIIAPCASTPIIAAPISAQQFDSCGSDSRAVETQILARLGRLRDDHSGANQAGPATQSRVGALNCLDCCDDAVADRHGLSNIETAERVHHVEGQG